MLSVSTPPAPLAQQVENPSEKVNQEIWIQNYMLFVLGVVRDLRSIGPCRSAEARPAGGFKSVDWPDGGVRTYVF